MLLVILVKGFCVFVVIDFLAPAENVFPFRYPGVCGLHCFKTCKVVQLLMGNGKFPEGDGNTLKHICSLLNSMWVAVMPSF